MKIIPIVFLLILCSVDLFGGIITGTIRDRESGEPISLASIQTENGGQAMPCNELGQYRLVLKPGKYRLKFSHIAHNSEWIDVFVADSKITLDVALLPAIMELKPIRVYDRRYDPAQRIIVEAIRHKEEILSQLQNYKCDAYTREVLHEQKKDSLSIIKGIVESQLVCFWEQPNKYKETIIARRQTANIDSRINLVSVEQIPNFNMNRIPFYQYSIVSPTAKDALKYYNYYLLDTIFIDDRCIFRLEFEPKNNTDPLAYGTVDIADSTFAVAGIEGGLSKAVYLPNFEDFHYSQRFSELQNVFMMPTEIKMTYKFSESFPVERTFIIDQITALHNYAFDTIITRESFDYVLEVAENADDIDSTAWNAGQLIPLTPLEKQGYRRIDSLESIPASLYKQIFKGISFLYLQAMGNYDLFHYNRVEGAYIGYGKYFIKPIPRLDLDIKTGYTFARENWQYHYGAYYLLQDKLKLNAGICYRDEIMRRLSILSSTDYNPTLFSLFWKIDMPNYYCEKGFEIFLGLTLLKKNRIYLIYQDYLQSSEIKNTDYSLFYKEKEFRPNPVITDGKLRSLRIRMEYDSRDRIKIKGNDFLLQPLLSTQFEGEIEIASPRLIDNDFNFVRYYLNFRRTGHTPLPGVTTTEIFIGGSNKELPPQRYYTVGFSYKLIKGMEFGTISGDDFFSGNLAAVLYISHNFGSWLFKKSGVPLVKNIPLSLSLYGGAFWTDFVNHKTQPGDNLLRTAPEVYSEIGFSIGRIPPLYIFSHNFTWQLSNYDTRRFSYRISFDFY